MNIDKLVRRNIERLKPYSSARDDYSGSTGIFMDANENPYDTGYNRYPDPYQEELKKRIATEKGVDPGKIFLGNGSDEVIDLLQRAYCEPTQDNILICPPTYGMYRVCADVNNVPVKKVPLTEEFNLDVKALKSIRDSLSKLLFLCSPNNPTGNDMTPEKVLEVTRDFPGLVVVDEAYIDFSGRSSYLSDLEEYPNLVVMQTFSKAWGMAAIRLGMAFADERVIRVLNKIKPPYNVNLATQELAFTALREKEAKEQRVARILEERKKLVEKLEASSWVDKVFPSDANFLLVRFKEARKILLTLIEHGVIVRDRSELILCNDCLRITVGTPEENERLLEVLGTLEEKDKLVE